MSKAAGEGVWSCWPTGALRSGDSWAVGQLARVDPALEGARTAAPRGLPHHGSRRTHGLVAVAVAVAAVNAASGAPGTD